MKQAADEQPGEQRHRERFDQPIDDQRDDDAAPVPRNGPYRSEIHAQQHRHDHQPDQQRNRNVHVGDRQRAEHLKRRRRQTAKRDAREDAQSNPKREVAFENSEAGARTSLGEGLFHDPSLTEGKGRQMQGQAGTFCVTAAVGSRMVTARHTASIAADPHRQAASPPIWTRAPESTMPIRRPAAFAA